MEVQKKWIKELLEEQNKIDSISIFISSKNYRYLTISTNCTLNEVKEKNCDNKRKREKEKRKEN